MNPKLYQQLKYRHIVSKTLKRQFINGDKLWIIQNETIWLLSKLVGQYQTILHQLEFSSSKLNWKYKLLSPTLKWKTIYEKAHKVICCEYNRAHFLRSLFNLPELPIILPNKPYFETHIEEVPRKIQELYEEFKHITLGKKIILYQGVFLDKERRLEEFCQAMDLLPSEYILVAMGRGSDMFDRLKKKYANERILFIPFIQPPYHMLITQKAYIGVMSYYPPNIKFPTMINLLYCAPNKIFEYGKYAKPMISNDVPALHYIFNSYNCGVCIDYPITPTKIAQSIETIASKYDSMSLGSFEYYNSVNMLEIVKSILME